MSNTSMTRFTEITQEVGTRIGYLFNDPRILWEALQAPGSIGNYFGRRRLPDGNKRLALLGDTALKLVLLREWYNGDGNRGKSPTPGLGTSFSSAPKAQQVILSAKWGPTPTLTVLVEKTSCIVT